MRSDETRGRDNPGGCDRKRRLFLGGAAGALAAAGAAALTPARASAHFFGFPFGFPFNDDGRRTVDVNAAINFAQIRTDESAYVTALQNQLSAVSGTQDTAPTLNIPTINNRSQFLTAAAALEDAIVAGYMLALTSTFNATGTRTLMAQLAASHGRHAGFANVVAGLNVDTNVNGQNPSLEFIPANVTPVNNALSTYISSGGGDLSGFTAPTSASAANDAVILNYALVLELVAQGFYGSNTSGNVRNVFNI